MHYCLLANLRHLQAIALCDMWWSKSLFISFNIRIKIWIFNLIFIHFRSQVPLLLLLLLLRIARLRMCRCAVVSTRCVKAQTPHQCSSIISIVRFRMLSSELFHFWFLALTLILQKNATLILQRTQTKLKIKF